MELKTNENMKRLIFIVLIQCLIASVARAYRDGSEIRNVKNKNYTMGTATSYTMDIKQVSLGGVHTMILMTDGTLWSVGRNEHGQLADGTNSDRNSLKQVISDVASVFTGNVSTMIVKNDGTLWACGSNTYGQLGDGTNKDRTEPVQVMTDVVSVSTCLSHTMILKKNGTLWACGRNDWGQLADETNNDRTEPVQVMTDVASVSVGEFHTMILKKDGTLWACGYNRYGQLGDGTTINSTTLQRVKSGVASVSVCGNYSMILMKNGTLWACGENSDGQLGDGTTTNRTTPVQVMSGVASVAAGDSHSLILKTDGTLWACGNNKFGQLCDGTTITRATPVQVMSDVVSSLARGGRTMIVKTDGTLWACGRNTWGQLGDGTNIDRYIPVQILMPKSIELSSKGYATFFDSQSAYTLPNGLSAQIVTNAANNKLTYKTIADGSVSGAIPAGTAVMLVSDNKQSGTYTLTATESSASYTGTNLLRGSDEAQMTTGDGYHYKLSYGKSGTSWSDVFGWYWGANNGGSFMTEGHKAWLVVPKSAGTTRGFTVDDETTGISTLEVSEEEAVYYDLQGRRVMNPTVKGVYIKNGKKVMVK